MKIPVALAFVLLSLTACRHTYYVVRHAEKATPSDGIVMSTPNDPPLSAAGEQRAKDLNRAMRGRRIKAIYTTNTIRAQRTAEPLREKHGINLQTYGPVPDSAFIAQLKKKRKNVLIVGHSNTVDDIVNGLTGKKTLPGDLNDGAYDNLYVVRYMHFFGTHVRFVWWKYGAEAPGTK